MKKAILVLGLIFSATMGYTQTKDYNQFSLELNYGVSVPVTPKTTDRSETIGFTHIKPTMRYMFNPKVGIKGFYAYDYFGEKNKGLSAHRLGAELVLNLDDLLNFPYYIKRNFGLQTHVGSGLGLLNPKSDLIRRTRNDFIGFIVVGGGPQVKLANWLSLFGDLSYNQVFKQDSAYNGLSIKKTTGNFVNISFGLQFYLGEENHHADWY